MVSTELRERGEMSRFLGVCRLCFWPRSVFSASSSRCSSCRPKSSFACATCRAFKTGPGASSAMRKSQAAKRDATKRKVRRLMFVVGDEKMRRTKLLYFTHTLDRVKCANKVPNHDEDGGLLELVVVVVVVVVVFARSSADGGGTDSVLAVEREMFRREKLLFGRCSNRLSMGIVVHSSPSQALKVEAAQVDRLVVAVQAEHHHQGGC
ncbi:hypothetical protein TYRP_011721 [Tyrophagus putrescentiae]|nr:hypothetical protein TYRP_011721 [Tyrophagus putrescentiae]